MNKIFDNKQEFTELYRDAVMSISGKSIEAASDLDRFNALAKLVAEKARTVATKSDARATAEGKKRVYYFSIEFLIGRLLDNYLLNFGVRDMVAEALDDMGFDLSVIENQEPDPALGNGGLGRLAACFLDSMAAEGIAGYGNGMRYRYGLFKQEIVNGSQVEATDEWLTHGYPWEVRRQDKAVTIKFGGHVEGFEESGRTFYRTVDTQDILAVPYDIPVVGYAGETVNKLRVWAAEPVEEHFDLEAFNRGDYALADAERAEAEAISAILYPNDAGEHGRLLRLKQEYLFVSAGIYSLLDTFEKEHGENWELLPQFVAIHTNDTHPAMCGPELMRILIDEKKLEWDNAWNIVTQVVSYTNHTILPEALEKWPIGTFSKLLPRVYQIIDEISRRWHESFDTTQEGWQERLRQTAILLVTDAIGDGWLKDAFELEKLKEFQNDTEFLKAVGASKRANKERLAAYVKAETGLVIDPNTVFDVQVKRFHAYKRQLMNIMKVMDIYNRRIADPNFHVTPTTFIFSGKAASSYTFAKETIRLINSVADVINNDARVNEVMKVCFIPNFRVSNAQLIYPAAEISEQISTAGKEASGTSNMKLMMNGAITLGTLDGANIEIADLAGRENEAIFGLTAPEVEQLWASNSYFAWDTLNNDRERLGRVMDELKDNTFAGLSGNFESIYNELMNNNDPDLVMADFRSYVDAWEALTNSYGDQETWNRKALLNTASSGWFSSDRTIREYRDEIWHA